MPVELPKFERADWTSFRTVEGLMQKAGVTKSKLRPRHRRLPRRQLQRCSRRPHHDAGAHARRGHRSPHAGFHGVEYLAQDGEALGLAGGRLTGLWRCCWLLERSGRCAIL